MSSLDGSIDGIIAILSRLSSYPFVLDVLPYICAEPLLELRIDGSKVDLYYSRKSERFFIISFILVL